MKDINCFLCEVCQEIYKDKNEALSCEKSHVDMGNLNIIQVKHEFQMSQWGFPEKLLIEISNYSGCLAEYRKTSEGSVEEYERYFKAIDDI